MVFPTFPKILQGVIKDIFSKTSFMDSVFSFPPVYLPTLLSNLASFCLFYIVGLGLI